MGKYPDSKLHCIFSDWHIRHCKETSYICDIDRLWVETRYGRPVAVFDIKYRDSMDEITPIEELLFNWFEDRGVPCYIVYFPKTFQVYNEGVEVVIKRKNKELALKERDFIRWIDLGLPSILD